MLRFRASRRYGRHPPYQTPKSGVPFARLPNNPLKPHRVQGGGTFAAEVDKVFTLETQKYGDNPNITPIVLAAGDQVIVQRSTTYRTWLFVQNLSTALGSIWVNFGAPAVIGQCMELVPGENLFMDSFVPQGVIHCTPGAAGYVAIVGSCNAAPFAGT